MLITGLVLIIVGLSVLLWRVCTAALALTVIALLPAAAGIAMIAVVLVYVLCS